MWPIWFVADIDVIPTNVIGVIHVGGIGELGEDMVGLRILTSINV